MNIPMSEAELERRLQTEANIHRIRKVVEKVEDEMAAESVEELDFNK